MNRTHSIIIDIETLSRKPSAVITEIGIIPFCRETFKHVEERTIIPCLFDQLQNLRHVCPETIAFHKKNKTLPTPSHSVSQKDAALTLRMMIKSYEPERIWIQGPDFDRPILEHFCAQVGEDLPWDYWRTSDSRTIWNIAFPDIKHAPRPHRAVADCIATLTDLHKALTHLKGDLAHEAA